MPDATHRIELRIDPHNESFPYDAAVYRLSDEMLRTITYGATRDEALGKARTWIARDTAPKDEPGTVYTDDDGDDAEPVQA